jgi:hypothetical protein
MNDPRIPGGPAQSEQRLDELFLAYREACEPREVSVNFMPELWEKIERTQSAAFSFRRMAKGFVTVAAALSLALALISFVPSERPAPVIVHNSYVDALAAHSEALDARNASESVEYVQDLIHSDSLEDNAAEI